MSCDSGCIKPPEIHIIDLDTTNIEEAWNAIFRDVVIFGSSTVKINYQDPEKAVEFYGKSPLENK